MGGKYDKTSYTHKCHSETCYVYLIYANKKPKKIPVTAILRAKGSPVCVCACVCVCTDVCVQMCVHVCVVYKCVSVVQKCVLECGAKVCVRVWCTSVCVSVVHKCSSVVLACTQLHAELVGGLGRGQA